MLTSFRFQLYSRRDDIVDDDDDDDHISEHLRVTEFAELVEMGHKRNYAAAAYLAAVENDMFSFNEHDFAQVMDQLKFVEVASVVVAGERSNQLRTSSKLTELIETVFAPIKGQEFFYVYKKSHRNDIVFHLDDESSFVEESIEAVSREVSTRADDEASSSGLNRSLSDGGTDFEEEASLNSSSLGDDGQAPRNVGATPIFARLLIDGEPATICDLARIGQSASLSAQISIFPEDEDEASQRLDPMSALPSSHVGVVAEMGSLLNAYVAEQTLERLRHRGPSIDVQDLRLARACLRKARNSVASTIEVFFYSPKSDSMVPASAPAGADAEVEEGFNLLTDELLHSDDIALKSFDEGTGLLLVDTEQDGSSLAYFCFLTIRKARGVVAVEVYHPESTADGSVVIARVHDSISRCCHRANQRLLLNKLHRSKTASPLLIPESTRAESRTEDEELQDSPFHQGLFACPTVFRTTFELFHRCATNPEQVSRTLEATVLHNFSVSNRRGFFVYKDEDGSVYYMKLVTTGGGLEPDGRIELVVQGLDHPGLSVTKQLRELLQRRLHSIAVDMLSAVLTKNPRYYWKPADTRFVRTFEAEWSMLNDSNSRKESSHLRRYSFPSHVFDPAMVLVYFRQNLCGSTFFHPLTRPERFKKSSGHGRDKDGKSSLGLEFYYNNAPSKLDPAVQALSTLTKKGAKYSRLAGTGLAIIELSLVYKDGTRIDELPLAQTPADVDCMLEVPLRFLRFAEEDGFEEESDDDRSSVLVEVRIADTALKRDILHDWIRLTLDQVLIAWTIETHLQRQQRGLLRLGQQRDGCPSVSEDTKKETLHAVCPGLPALTSMLESSHGLPHPAVLKVQYDGVVRSSTVATFACDLLEAILSQMRLKTKSSRLEDYRSSLCAIRLNRSEPPRRVLLPLDSSGPNAVVTLVDQETRTDIRDTPIDCPEYILFYQSMTTESTLKLFQEVAIDDGTGESTESTAALKLLRKQNPSAFKRSFGFVFTVRKDKRTLIGYNWSTQLFNATRAHLEEKEKQLLALTSHSRESLQRRALRLLSPYSNSAAAKVDPKPKEDIDQRNSKSKLIASSAGESVEKEHNTGERTYQPRRHIRRPVNIRKPTLIGKSVDGAARHAVAASRARASSNLFKGNLSTSSNAQTGRKPVDSSRRGSGDRLTIGIDGANSDRQQSSLNRSNREKIGVASLQSSYKRVLTADHLRPHSAQVKASSISTRNHWPTKRPIDMTSSVSDLVLHEGSMMWTEASSVLPLPPRLVETLVSSFAQSMAVWTPELSLVPVQSCCKSASLAILSGELRAVRKCKGVTVVKVSRMRVVGPNQNSSMILLQTYLLTMPRREKDGKRTTKKRRYNSWALIEKDAAGTDLLSCSLRSTLNLRKALFDHAAATAERAMKSINGDLQYSEVLSLVRDLITMYSLRQQRKLLRSNYKCFSTTIVLKSYRDPMISGYDAPSLFRWIQSKCLGRTVISCGPAGVCFKREVIVGSTHSVCFLAPDPNATDRLRLIILCRTQGRNLHDFMFREDSNAAISIVDNIAVECAGLAYGELHFAATNMYRDRIWNRVSSASTLDPPSPGEVRDLLGLCKVKPVSDYVQLVPDLQRFKMIFSDDGMDDFSYLCDLLTREQTLSPSWTVGDSEMLVYSSAEDIYLLLHADDSSHKTRIDVVEREEGSPKSVNNPVFALQKAANVLLFSLWSDMAEEQS